MLKVDPHLPAKLLRPLLMNSVAQGDSVTSQYMANFRRRCAIFHATNHNSVHLTISDCVKLTNTARISAKEEDMLLVPNINKNYRDMFTTIMQSGTQTWKALAYLNKLKRELVGFDYRIHYNSEGLPDAIVWMTLQMKKNLLQYGDILFLDCQ